MNEQTGEEDDDRERCRTRGLPLLDDLGGALARAQRSARSMLTTETTDAGSCSSTTVWTISTIRVSGIFPSRNAMTATSLAAFMTAGKVRPRPPDAVRQVDRRERLAIDGLERERRSVSGTGCDAGGQPLRPRERELDRQPHVWDGHLGTHAAVPELRHRVHHALRVDQRRGSASSRGRRGSAPRSPRDPCSSAWRSRS